MIERLTDYFGEKYICIKGCKSLYENAERKGAPASNAIVRLAAYEDTGWSPEEIKAMAPAATLRDRDAELERLWAEFGDVPMNPETECMGEPFLGFPAGTHREDIWHWFDERHSRGVAYLLNGDMQSVKKCYVVTDNSYDVGLSTYAFWNREDAERSVRESVASVVAELKERDWDRVEVLEQGDSFSVYVPDTGISYDWTISEADIR